MFVVCVLLERIPILKVQLCPGVWFSIPVLLLQHDNRMMTLCMEIKTQVHTSISDTGKLDVPQIMGTLGATFENFDKPVPQIKDRSVVL